MAIDRGVVEVGAELVDSILRFRPHEGLSAEADDGLLSGAVTVVLEALAVVADEPHVVLFGPEDVVRKEAVAVVRGLLGDFRAADAAVPNKGRHTIQRPRRRLETLQRRAKFALPVDEVFGPKAVQQGVVLDRQLDAVTNIFAEPRVDRAGVAAAHHEVGAAVGEVLQHRVVLGDLHRVVRGDKGCARTEDQLRRLRRDVRERGRGAR